MTTLDDVVQKYAKECERIYERRTAGDDTWYGVLSVFWLEAHKALNDSRSDDSRPQTERDEVASWFERHPDGVIYTMRGEVSSLAEYDAKE